MKNSFKILGHEPGVKAQEAKAWLDTQSQTTLFEHFDWLRQGDDVLKLHASNLHRLLHGGGVEPEDLVNLVGVLRGRV